MSRTGSSFIAVSLSLLMLAGTVTPAAFAADEPQLNFKIYNPEGAGKEPSDEAPSTDETSSDSHFSVPITPSLQPESAQLDESKPAPAAKAETPVSESSSVTTTTTDVDAGATTSGATEKAATDTTDKTASKEKTLKGYVKVVPTGTKIPIIMDTAVDSDTSQEGDEFAARTAEDLTIDGSTVVPAGSIIKGRIAQLNSPKALNRSGSVGMKFDSITTPDQRQIPIVANLVARGGVVHAKRGLRDVSFDTGAVALPLLAGLAIGFLAGGASSTTTTATATTTTTTAAPKSTSKKIGRPEGAAIGAAVGLAVGVAILLAKKGKKVEVRPGDELKIELAEELKMPEVM